MTQRTLVGILSVVAVGVLAAGIAAVAPEQNERELGAAVAVIDTDDVVSLPPPGPDPRADEPTATEATQTPVSVAPSSVAPTPRTAPLRTQPAPADSDPTSGSAGVDPTTQVVHVPTPAPAPVATTPAVPSAPVPPDDVAPGETGGNGEDVDCDDPTAYSEGCEPTDTEVDDPDDVEPTPATCLPDTETELPAPTCVPDDGAEIITDPPPTSPNVTCTPANSDGTGPLTCTSSDGGVVPPEPPSGLVPPEEEP